MELECTDEVLVFGTEVSSQPEPRSAIVEMQARRDDQDMNPRGHINPAEPFPKVMAQHHFQDGTEGIPSGMPFPLPTYAVTPPSVHAPSFHGGLSMQVQAHHQSQMHQVNAVSHPQGQQQAQFQRLKVEDALSYLDQVKLQFGSQPQVYNDFLDIMKEFKSQAIDTPGVISRVSNLFKGHPDLIVGFNTFLPPGYKIEVNSTDSTISVQQPGQPSIALSQLGQPQHTATAAVIKTPHHTPAVHSSSHHTYHKPTAEMSPHGGGSGAVSGASSGGGQSTQPVEFNHAINYVNKIKNRFQGQPDIYKNFLEILHTYQKEQRQLKESMLPSGYKPLSEAEVYSQVAKLFHNQEDLLSEFGQFLPDANGSSSTLHLTKSADYLRDHASALKKQSFGSKSQSSKSLQHLRRPSNGSMQPVAKKAKPAMLKDVSLAEAAKWASLPEYAFFDRVRKALKSPEVYDNFLRCLVLFNQEVIARSELVQLVQPFLAKFPELFRWFKDFLGYKEQGGMVESLPGGALKKDRNLSDLGPESPDYSSCKRYGVSYRAVPKSYNAPKCSGRTPLCREVLNETWVSFPTWSEDSTFVTSRKTIFEENVYRCEDERFELDVVIEANSATIKVLEAVQKKLSRMTTDEAAKFHLDNTLGGTSEFIHKRAIQRIYGDKATDIVDGLKKNPVVAVPLVLRRLKAKDEEWRDAQKQFNKIWREQNEKYYLKSLDHQSLNFKPNDAKALRSKALLNEIDSIYEERLKEVEASSPKPHMTLVYKDKAVLSDAFNLIMHHLKRQSSVHKEEKQKMKVLLRHHIQDMFHLPRQELSDDEEERDDNDDAEDGSSDKKKKDDECSSADKPGAKPAPSSSSSSAATGSADREDDDEYALFCANSHWYLFFRLHNILCDRLHKIYKEAQVLAEEEAVSKKEKSQSTAIALKLKSPIDVSSPDAYYGHFLEMVKSLLDGNIEAASYEDTLREMFGIHAYITFTLDKVVQNIVRQLQHIVSDETSQEVMELFLKERHNGATGGLLATRSQRALQETAYEKQAESMCDECCYQIQTFKKDCCVTINLRKSEGDSESGSDAKRWAQYVEKYTTCNEDSLSDELKEHLAKKPMFLQRNVRYWSSQGHDMPDKKVRHDDEEKESLEDGNGKERNSEDSGGGTRDEEDTQDSTAPINTSLQRKKMAMAAADNLFIMDTQECRFNSNAFKMQFVNKSETLIYRRKALTKAKEAHKAVSSTKYAKYNAFIEEWLQKNVADDAASLCDQWLLGEAEEYKECFTTKVAAGEDGSTPPYHTYHRYKVSYASHAEYGSDNAEDKEVESMELA